MRIAAFSDTHGNLLGLEAVLADIARHGAFDHLLMGGDLVAGGPRPVETLACIRALECPVVLGNTDFYLFAGEGALAQAALKPKERRMDAWAAAQIGREGVEYLQALPFSYHLRVRMAECAWSMPTPTTWSSTLALKKMKRA